MDKENHETLMYYCAVKWVKSIKGYGRIKTREVIDQIDDIEKFAFGSYEDLKRHFGHLNLPIREWIHKRDYQKATEKYHEQLRQSQKIYHYWHPDYPVQLREVNDPPLFLYAKGDHTLLNQPKIAVVGTRVPTDYGRKYGYVISKLASDNGKTVVSGMAMGVDAVAHMAAIEGRGSSIGVLGCGIDQIYPKQNTKLFREMSQKGLLLTEYEAGEMPHPIHFPERNRIIAGLSQTCIVIEAAKKSGSLITAEMAMDLGRDVLALPGPIYSEKSAGCHELIRSGAEPIIDTKELENLWKSERKTTQADGGALEKMVSANPIVIILKHLGQATAEELVKESGLSFGEVITHLDELEKNKIVKSFGFFYHL